jgi:Nucleotidyl transferase AbiEii toxin, Type IV TA system
MIPRACITGWRAAAPWSNDAQVEQDLVLSRALVDVFNSPELAANLVFRGGTALHKLCFAPARRYSEDLDLDLALRTVEELDRGKIVECLNAYLEHQGLQVSRAEFEKNLHAKRQDERFAADVFPLLASVIDGTAEELFDPDAAFDRVLKDMVALLPGAPWKGSAGRG